MGRKFRLAVHRKNENLMVKDKSRATVEEQELTVSIPLNKVQLVMMISIPTGCLLEC